MKWATSGLGLLVIALDFLVALDDSPTVMQCPCDGYQKEHRQQYG
jgi:hypothetical protein